MSSAAKQHHSFKRFNKGNLNSFIFFLILAALFWVLTKFSKEYTQDVKAQLEFINVPEDAVIGGNTDRELPLRMEASGFDFLFYQIRRPVITVDVSDLNPGQDSIWTISKAQLEIQAEQLFNHPVEITLKESEIKLPLLALGKRTVPVVPAVTLEFKEGYAALAPMELQPDSITLIGPVKVLDQLLEIYTEQEVLANLDAAVSGELKLELPDSIGQVKMVPDKVSYQLDVEEFIENEMMVPLTLIGNEENLGIQLFPSAVKVRYTINFGRYKNIQASDFKVVCDLSKATGGNLLSPQLVAYPEGAQNVSFLPEAVEFIVIQ